jgi:hypothetical protein
MLPSITMVITHTASFFMILFLPFFDLMIDLPSLEQSSRPLLSTRDYLFPSSARLRAQEKRISSLQ